MMGTFFILLAWLLLLAQGVQEFSDENFGWGTLYIGTSIGLAFFAF